MGLFKSLKELVKINNQIKKYSDMSAQELYNLKDNELYEALECFTSDEMYNDPNANEAQKVYSVVSYFHSNIIEGSLCKFFVYADIECYQLVSECLEAIGAYKTKELFDNFVRDNEIDLTDDKVFCCYNDDEYLELFDLYPFEEFDEPYCESDEVFNSLIEYARMNTRELTGK